MVAVRHNHAGVVATKVVVAPPKLGPGRRHESGFTLVEVMIAMLVGTIGLLGTLAILQTIISASKNANDSAIAMRLASQKLDELSSRNTDTLAADQAMGLFPLVDGKWWPRNASDVPVPEYVNAEGICFCNIGDGTPKVPGPAEMGIYRWRRQWKVVDLTEGQPYVVSVIVSFTNDVGDTKTTRMDLERRKTW